MAVFNKRPEKMDSNPRLKPTPAPKAKAKAKAKPAKKKAVMYASKRLVMFHPTQKMRFLPGQPVECRLDDWLEGQIKAGLIKVV